MIQCEKAKGIWQYYTFYRHVTWCACMLMVLVSLVLQLGPVLPSVIITEWTCVHKVCITLFVLVWASFFHQNKCTRTQWPVRRGLKTRINLSATFYHHVIALHQPNFPQIFFKYRYHMRTHFESGKVKEHPFWISEGIIHFHFCIFKWCPGDKGKGIQDISYRYVITWASL